MNSPQKLQTEFPEKIFNKQSFPLNSEKFYSLCSDDLYIWLTGFLENGLFLMQGSLKLEADLKTAFLFDILGVRE